MNVIFIHGLNHKYDGQFWLGIEKYCKEHGINIIKPEFPNNPLSKETNYRNWEKSFNDMLEKEKPDLSETIVIAHSLGSTFMSRYLIENEIDLAGYISLAGALKTREQRMKGFSILKHLIMKLPKVKARGNSFTLPSPLYLRVKSHAKHRAALYSSTEDDKYFALKQLTEFVDLIQAEKHPVEFGGHLSRAPEIVHPVLFSVLDKMTGSISKDKNKKSSQNDDLNL